MKNHDPQTAGPNVYRHYECGLYRVLDDNVTCSTNGPDDGKRMVLYVSLTNGRVFTRTYDQFFEDLAGEVRERDGQPHVFPRFTRMLEGTKL